VQKPEKLIFLVQAEALINFRFMVPCISNDNIEKDTN
jgi:hypothetical protein